MVKRKVNLYSRPRKLFDSVRIAEEGAIQKKYGLKNKTEIWKASAKISNLRSRAKKLISRPEEEKKEFFTKLNGMGFSIKDISEVLALKTENWLDRRLQTFVFNKQLAKTILEARQLIAHKNVLVDGKVVNVPSFFVFKNMEGKISLREQKAKKQKVEEEVTE